MINIILKGGLGNQMFRAAAGIALSQKNNCKCKLDLSFLIDHKNDSGDYVARELELQIFKDLGLIYFDSKFRSFPRIIRGILRLKEKYKYHLTYTVFEQTDFAFDARFLELKQRTIIDSDCQSETFFLSYSKLIKDRFRFPKLNDESKNICKEMLNSNSVSIHIRRSDYLNETINKINGVCTLEYYYMAIELIKSKIESPDFYIFSDDIHWVKSEFRTVLNDFTLIDWNKNENSWQDMALMSKCKHNIIANSSFSWWGAWLNENPEKIVIAPLKWFNTQDKYYNTKDIIPTNWLKI